MKLISNNELNILNELKEEFIYYFINDFDNNGVKWHTDKYNTIYYDEEENLWNFNQGSSFTHCVDSLNLNIEKEYLIKLINDYKVNVELYCNIIDV